MNAPRPLLLAGLAALVLAGCASEPVVNRSEPPFYKRLDIAGRQVDPASSLSMINQYRANNGLPPLVWDETLTRVADAQARRMADRDSIQSSLEIDGDLKKRLDAAGVRFKTSGENVSAGYRTFAEAFSGWRDSKPHNAVMLHRTATRVGLSTAYTPSSKYKVFWSMVVAEPN